ncbi:MAG TPA: peptidoglycan-binding domain-containing protein [Solirubrobacteraceae bacterium]
MAAAREVLRRVARAGALTLCVLACAGPAMAASGGRAVPLARAGQQASAPVSLTGQAMWIWELGRTEGGNLARIVARARQYGLSAVYVKAGDGSTPWPQFSPTLVATLHAAGLRVCAWQFVYGRSPVGEANAGATAVAQGADCLIVDAESSYEGRYLAARRYVRALRSRIGAAYPLALTSFPYVDYHPAFPYSVFLGASGAQVNMPQVYWKDIGNTVDVALARTWMLNRVYQRPMHLIGQLYQAPTATDVLRFRTLANAYGAVGTSWWDWQEAPARLWSVLAQPITAPAAAAVPDPGWPVLTRRSKGDLVVRAQQLLRAGGRRVSATGIYGAQTAAAVRRLQSAAGIPVTGVVDSATWQTLLRLPVTPAPVVSPVAPAPAPTPVAPSTGGSAAKVARQTGGVPASADLPAVRDELAGKP